MDSTLRTVGAIALALALGSPVAVAEEGPRCSNKTLKGTYEFSVTGFLEVKPDDHGTGSLEVEPVVYVPEAYAAFTSYDGLGNIVLKKTSLSDEGWHTQISTGTYQMERGCTALATYPGAKFQYYVAPDGSSFSFVKITGFDGQEYVPTGDRLASSAVRISKKSLVTPVE